MKNSELVYDKKCHVLYSKECEKEIKNKIKLHYKEDEQEEIWNKIQKKYIEFLSNWRKDLGGKKNFHNGKGGTYDSIALITYYAICKEVTSIQEVQEMECNIILEPFKKMKFVDCNKPIFRKLMYKAFSTAKKKCDKWHDYEMNVAKLEKGKPIYYEFTACPVAEFAKKHNLIEIMPALCNPDYKAMELIHAKLVRTKNCATDDKCDYTICGDKDDYLKDHPEYIDEMGFIRNR